MSKILKFIVNMVILMAIVVAATLLVPPFAGVDTVMNDNTETETNLPIGSVAYGKSVSPKELKVKDKIIHYDGASTYVYKITEIDAGTAACKVKDIYNKGSEEEIVTLQKTVPKVVITVPFIGYAAIALQSKEGLIVIGLGIVFLIILFILSELWRKDEDDEEEESDEDNEAEDEEEDDEEDEDDDELSWKERRRLKKEEKRRRKMEKKKKADDEDEEDEDDDEYEDNEEEAQVRVTAPDSDMRASKPAEEAEVQEQPVEATRLMPDAEELEAAIQASADNVEVEETVREEAEAINIEETLSEERPVNADEVPSSPTLAELLAKAEAAGENPEVVEDEENKVTLLDYSDIL